MFLQSIDFKQLNVHGLRFCRWYVKSNERNANYISQILLYRESDTFQVCFCRITDRKVDILSEYHTKNVVSKLDPDPFLF